MGETKGLYLSKIALAGCLVGGFSIILVVGLLCGLVARPNNCIKPSTTVTDSTTVASTSTKPSTNINTDTTNKLSMLRLFL